MKFTKTILLSIMCVMLFTISVYANSAPVIMEEAPGFSIAPVGSTKISVQSEDLEFDMRSGNGGSARVTASYEMKNTSDAKVEQAMLFPFVTSRIKGFTDGVKITANGKAVDFKTYRLEDLTGLSDLQINYKDNINKELAEKIDIENIVKMLNNRQYAPQKYSLDQMVTVYTLDLSGTNREHPMDISIGHGAKEHTIMYYNFCAVTVGGGSSDKLSTWASIGDGSTARNISYILVLGQDTGKGLISSSAGDKLNVQQMTMEDFLKNCLVRTSIMDYGIKDSGDMYSYVIKQMDNTLNSGDYYKSLDNEVISKYLYGTYIGAFLYTVNFNAQSTTNVTVQYDMKATTDRSRTREFTNMFLYLLRPAAGWKEFKGLNIKIIPNKEKPYIIESSLPFVKDDKSGIYKASFEKLPDKDFYFTTYRTEKAEPQERPVAGLASFMNMIIVPAVLIVVLVLAGALVLWLVLRRKRR